MIFHIFSIICDNRKYCMYPVFCNMFCSFHSFLQCSGQSITNVTALHDNMIHNSHIFSKHCLILTARNKNNTQQHFNNHTQYAMRVGNPAVVTTLSLSCSSTHFLLLALLLPVFEKTITYCLCSCSISEHRSVHYITRYIVF